MYKKRLNISIWPIDSTLADSANPVRVDLSVIVEKRYSTFPKLQKKKKEFHSQMPKWLQE